MSAGRTREIAAILVILVIGIGACSGSDDAANRATPEEPVVIGPRWSAAGATVAQTLSAQLGGDTGDCVGFAAYDRAGFLLTFQRLGWPIPMWVGSCAMANGEDLQIEIWKDPAKVAERLRTKADRLCGEHNGALPGYAFVEGPTFVLQPDTRSGAESLAARVGGVARWQEC